MQFDFPARVLGIPLRLEDLSVEAGVFAKTILCRNVLNIAEDLSAFRVRSRPLWVELERKRIQVGWNIARGPWIRIK